MVVYEFSPDDLTRIRFAISPLGELINSLEALNDPASASIHLRWIRAVRPRLAGLDLGPLATLARRRPGMYRPDFLAPPPKTPLPDVHQEIERIRLAAPAQVRWELREAYPDEPIPPELEALHSDPEAAITELADLAAAYLEIALEPHWEAIRDVLEDDIAHRARLLTTAGQLEIFDDLHPDVRSRDRTLEVEHPYQRTVKLAGRGLMLVPSAFIWPRTGALLDPPWQPALIYPARGIGNLWAPTRQNPQALADLIGARRATILAGLEREASTTTIARGSEPAGPASPSISSSCAAQDSSARAATAAKSSTPAHPPQTRSYKRHRDRPNLRGAATAQTSRRSTDTTAHQLARGSVGGSGLRFGPAFRRMTVAIAISSGCGGRLTGHDDQHMRHAHRRRQLLACGGAARRRARLRATDRAPQTRPRALLRTDDRLPRSSPRGGAGGAAARVARA